MCAFARFLAFTATLLLTTVWVASPARAEGPWEASGHGLTAAEYVPGDQQVTLKTCTQIAFDNGYEVVTDLGNSRFLYRRGPDEAWKVSPVPVRMPHSLLYNPADRLFYADDTANHRMIAFPGLDAPELAAEATEMAEVKLDRPHDVVRDPATGWLYMINPNEPVVVRFRALGVDETALDLDDELNYSRGLTFTRGRLYVVGSSLGRIVEVTDFDQGHYEVHLGHGKKAEAPAGNWLRTGLVPNDLAWFDGWWYLTSYFTPVTPYSQPGEDADTNKFIRFRDWAAFREGRWEDISDLTPPGATPYYLTVHDGALYLALFFDGGGRDAILKLAPTGGP